MAKHIFSGLLQQARSSVTGRSLWWHATAIALTFILVITGFDWWFYEQTRSAFFHPLIWLAGIGGFFVPVLVPAIMYITGEWRQNSELRRKAVAIVQAVIIAWVLIAIYKAFTGRIQPEFMNTVGNTDISRGFQFGFWRNGIFWGWPSSHTAVAVAGSLTLLRLSKSVMVRFLAVLYMVIIAAGAGIGFHWFSDVVAGIILGVLVGNIVAKSFQNNA